MCLPWRLCFSLFLFLGGCQLVLPRIHDVQRRLFVEGTVGVLHIGSRRQLGVVMTRYDD